MNSAFASAARLTASIWLAAGMVAFADPALATAAVDRPQVQVQTADLNLGAPAGRATAERRIRAAAVTVCSTADVTDQRCMDKAISDAEHALDRQAGQVTTLAAK